MNYMGIDTGTGEDKTVIRHYFNGMEVVVNDMVCVGWDFKQWYFPVSKKKRIQKKFRKKNWCYGKFTKYYIYTMGSKIIVSQKTFDKLKKYLITLPGQSQE